MDEFSKKLLKKKLNNADFSTHKKVSAICAVLFFAFIILADVCLILHHDVTFSANENRILAQAPPLTGAKLLSGKFMTQFEDFVSDQFFGRDSWITSKLKIDKALGRKESNGIYLGKDGYLFETDAVPDTESVNRSLEAVGSFAKEYPSVRFVMSIVPNASCIYPDKVPKGAPSRDQHADILQFQKLLSEKVQFVDLYDDLTVHSKEPLYYRSDHHWTSLGARYAFEKLAPALQLSDLADKYTVMTAASDFSGTLASASGSFTTTDTVDIYVAENTPDYYVEYDGDAAKYSTIYSSKALEEKNKYEVFFGGNYPEIRITTTNETGKNLLLLKDSYANCLVQFLLPYYDHIVIVDPRYYSDDLSAEMKNSQITDVLVLYNENTFVLDNSLAGVLLPE